MHCTRRACMISNQSQAVVNARECNNVFICCSSGDDIVRIGVSFLFLVEAITKLKDIHFTIETGMVSNAA